VGEVQYHEARQSIKSHRFEEELFIVTKVADKVTPVTRDLSRLPPSNVYDHETRPQANHGAEPIIRVWGHDRHPTGAAASLHYQKYVEQRTTTKLRPSPEQNVTATIGATR
jgi:hypothetical protein